MSYYVTLERAGRRDAVGRTPLHMGAMSGSLDTCRKLVSAGAVIDARDNLGRLALIQHRLLFIYRVVDCGGSRSGSHSFEFLDPDHDPQL
jgi:hypothetical protein